MKHYEQLMKHYWGAIVPMAEEHNRHILAVSEFIKPWECVRYKGMALHSHPEFSFPLEDYTFALTVLEGKPVWEGSVLYNKKNNKESKVLCVDSIAGWIHIECEGHSDLTTPLLNYTWAPPTKTRTFLINGHEVPEPMREKPDLHTPYYFVDARTPNGINEFIWKDDTWDNNIFNSIGCHLTCDNCIIHAKALFSFSEVE